MAELGNKRDDFDAALEGQPTVVIVEHAPDPIPANRPRKVYAGMWGPAEIGAVAAGTLAVLMALVAYFFWVVPSNRELVKNRAEADRLEAESISAKAKYGEITDTKTQVSKIVDSIDDFETRFLPASSNGQAALYQRLNGLIAAYDLVNTTGPDYTPLETIDVNAGNQSEAEKGRARYRSLYPGVYVTTTLEGSYQNLRRFIREIETGREFVIVSAVELAPAENDGKKEKNDPSRPPVAVNPAAPGPIFNDARGIPMPMPRPQDTAPIQSTSQKNKGKTHGETVSLNIELAAYFRRPSVAPAVVR